jgi:hypothetical protein
LRPFPDFDYQARPYILIKDRSSLTVVNIKSKQCIIVVKDCPLRWDSTRDYTLEVSMSEDQNKLEVFTI